VVGCVKPAAEDTTIRSTAAFNASLLLCFCTNGRTDAEAVTESASAEGARQATVGVAVDKCVKRCGSWPSMPCPVVVVPIDDDVSGRSPAECRRVIFNDGCAPRYATAIDANEAPSAGDCTTGAACDAPLAVWAPR
jgi:hypothetical protein